MADLKKYSILVWNGDHWDTSTTFDDLAAAVRHYESIKTTEKHIVKVISWKTEITEKSE